MRKLFLSIFGFSLVITACSDNSQQLEPSETLNPDEVQQLDVVENNQNFDYSQVNYDNEPASAAIFDGFENDSFPPALINSQEIFQGCPSPDCIPAIDEPKYIEISEVSGLENNEPVIVVEINGDAKAFPVGILIRHEIVNTEIGDIPISVTYCPLCNSALSFDRRVGNRLLDFGVSGKLYNSALLMYDRQTGSLWTHFDGNGVIGHYSGAKLKLIPSQTVAFEDFVKAHPTGQVLSPENEHNGGSGTYESYGFNPYQSEDSTFGTSGSFFGEEFDERLPRKERVVAINDNNEPLAIPFSKLANEPVQQLENNIVVFYEKGLASPLDTSEISEGRDIGKSGVFISKIGDQDLTFETSVQNGETVFIDLETKSSWNILGQAISGELKGEALEAVPHLDAFWFAWAAYQPDTEILD